MWRPWASGLVDAVYPPACLLCGAPAWDDPLGPLCPACARRLPAPVARCRRCARPAPATGGGPGCARCSGPLALRDALGLGGPRAALAGVVAGADYAGAARELVLVLKFAGRRGAARVRAEGLAEALRAAGTPGDLLVPVPLSARRQRERGFNQARLLAERLAVRLGLPLAPPRALQKRRHTPRQSALSPGRRRRAARGGWRADPARVTGRCVLLVDDVLTSGATARACARALRRAGAAAVVAAVACRAAYGRPAPHPAAGRV